MVQAVIYSAIYGKYDTPKPRPVPGVPCVLFTESEDTGDRARELGWIVRHVNHGIATRNGDPAITAPMLGHKWWKCRSDLLPMQAEVSIWLDGSLTPKSPDFVSQCLAALGDDDISFMPHPERRCIYPEADYSAVLTWRYDAASMQRQAQHYRRFHPADFGLVATGLIVRRHSAKVTEFGKAWWYENVMWSHQDQISVMPVLRAFGEMKGLTWNTNMPWLGLVDLHVHG